MFVFTMGDSSHIQPLDVSGPGHVVAERWRKWRRSFLYHVEGKGLTDKRRCRSLLLSLAGEEVQDIWDALQPSLPGRVADELDQCITALNKHFSVVRNVPYERHLFRQLNQLQEETTAQFVVRLQKQAQFCEFADATDQLRDQLLQGMIDPELREKLLEEPSNSNWRMP